MIYLFDLSKIPITKPVITRFFHYIIKLIIFINDKIQKI